jgi:hypothetical protein
MACAVSFGGMGLPFACKVCAFPPNQLSSGDSAPMNLVRLFLGLYLAVMPAVGGTLIGHVRDQNWFARYQGNPAGVGYYEYAVNANGANPSSAGGAAATDVFGVFQMTGLPTGSYTVASWDVWWRSAFKFGVSVPVSGNSVDADLRLQATMWGYPAFWNPTGYQEFGQTFVASGPVTMIYLRNPLVQNSPTLTLTVHDGGPTGAQVGVARTLLKDFDIRVIYGYGEMPTVKGRTYYVRIRSSSTGAVLCQMDPRPDFSDPMPGGSLYLGDGITLTPQPDRDLGIVIMADDDGLITNLHTRQNGTHVDASSVGQTFIARGVNLISGAFWLADPTFPTYVVRVYQDGPGGAAVGTTKRGRLARPADPQMLVTWPPGECPLMPGQTYYVEVTKDGGGVFNVAQVNRTNPFLFGEAYANGTTLAGVDLAGTLMEEESVGSATRAAVQILSGPTIVESARSSNQMTIAWTTDVPSDSEVAYVVEYPLYVFTNYSAALMNNHSVTLSDLQPNSLYHFQVRSAATNYRDAISRDFVGCTRPASSNLLVNGSFEEGVGASPRSAIPGWTKTSGVDIRASDGTWFFSLKPTNGAWFCQGAVNGTASDGYIYQRVEGITPGQDYTFSAWVLTAHRENSTFKYDVWDRDNRLIHVRLGIDPTGATNPTASTVEWTPRMYSHLRYTQLGKTVFARSNAITVFVRMNGQGGDWHLYGVDDCVLTHEEVPLRFGASRVVPNNRFELTLYGKANRTNELEASTTLTNWSFLGLMINRGGVAQARVPIPSSSTNRFFRARPR